MRSIFWSKLSFDEWNNQDFISFLESVETAQFNGECQIAYS